MFWAEASFHERSVWVSLVAVALVDSYYFWQVARIGDGLNAAHLLGILGVIAGALIAIELCFLGAQRLFGGPRTVDERDDLISAKAHRLAYLVLLVGVGLALVVLLLRADANSATGIRAASDVLQLAHLEVHLFIGALVGAELVRFGAQLWFYRRGL